MQKVKCWAFGSGQTCIKGVSHLSYMQLAAAQGIMLLLRLCLLSVVLIHGLARVYTCTARFVVLQQSVF